MCAFVSGSAFKRPQALTISAVLEDVSFDNRAAFYSLND